MFERLINSRWWYPAIGAIVALVLLTIILGVGSCGRDRSKEKQVEQSAASAQAANAAGSNAVNVASSVAASEAKREAETREGMGDIHNAQTADDVRSAVIDRLCKTDTYRLDPACRVRGADTF